MARLPDWKKNRTFYYKEGNSNRTFEDYAKSVAYHEAGHALAAYVVGREIKNIELNLDNTEDAIINHFNKWEYPIRCLLVERVGDRIDREEAFISMAGGAGESLYTGNLLLYEIFSHNCHSDMTSIENMNTKEMKKCLRSLEWFMEQPDITSSIKVLAEILLEADSIDGKEVHTIIEDLIPEERRKTLNIMYREIPQWVYDYINMFNLEYVWYGDPDMDYINEVVDEEFEEERPFLTEEKEWENERFNEEHNGDWYGSVVNKETPKENEFWYGNID